MPDRTPPLISVLIACNDDRGDDTGEFSRLDVELPSGLLELEGPALRYRWLHPGGYNLPASYTLGHPVIKVYGHGRYPVFEHTKYAGNLLWDLLTIPARNVARLLNHLRLLAAWDCNAGPSEVYGLWRARDWNALRMEHLIAPAVKEES